MPLVASSAWVICDLGTDGQDGIYLDVRDLDTSSGDPDYYLDTPVSTTTDANGAPRP